MGVEGIDSSFERSSSKPLNVGNLPRVGVGTEVLMASNGSCFVPEPFGSVCKRYEIWSSVEMDSSISESISATAESFFPIRLGGWLAGSFSFEYQPSNIDSKLGSKVRFFFLCSVERILSKAREADVTPMELRLQKISFFLASLSSRFFLLSTSGENPGDGGGDLGDLRTNGSNSLTVIAECCNARSRIRRACCQELELI